jgi:hypothetical protein
MSQPQITQAMLDRAIADRVNTTATRFVNDFGYGLYRAAKYVRWFGITMIYMGTTDQIINYRRWTSQGVGDIAVAHVLHHDSDMTVLSDLHYDKTPVDKFVSSILQNIKLNMIWCLGGYVLFFGSRFVKSLGRDLKDRKITLI